jgi:hypothetical protein
MIHLNSLSIDFSFSFGKYESYRGIRSYTLVPIRSSLANTDNDHADRSQDAMRRQVLHPKVELIFNDLFEPVSSLIQTSWGQEIETAK